MTATITSSGLALEAARELREGVMNAYEQPAGPVRETRSVLPA